MQPQIVGDGPRPAIGKHHALFGHPLSHDSQICPSLFPTRHACAWTSERNQDSYTPAMRRRPWRNGKRYRAVSLFGVLAVSAALMSWPSVHQAHKTGSVDFKAAAVPTPAHVVVVGEESRSQTNIIGKKS